MTTAPLIIVSGPSGSGKSTIIDRVLTRCDRPLRHAVSATTRSPRPNEINGKAYYFWNRAEFERAVSEDAFLEWAEVHGNYYGTLRSEVEPYRIAGTGVIVDIDVQGAAQLRKAVPDLVSLFLQASSMDEYERRLRERGTEDEATLQRRLTNARRELQQRDEYHYHVTNDDLDRAVDEVLAIVRQSFGGDAHVG